MNIFLIIIGIAIFLLLIVLTVALVLLYRRTKEPPKDNQSLMMMQQQLQELSKVVDTRLHQNQQSMQVQFGQSTKAMQTQFGQSNKAIADVTEKLTKLDETNKQVVGVAEQLQGLENILKNPKHRGVLGEYYLENVLKNVLPPAGYQMQYAFKNNDIVDAVIFVGEKIIPIDSKFSLENYNRLAGEKDPARHKELEKQFKMDLKQRIDETAKYIKPAENTMDFAFMFIPAEGIYYDLLVSQVGAVKINTRDLIEYAFKDKRVIIVSPTSFFAYLQTVLQGLRALKIEESAKEIRTRVEQLSRHLKSYEEYMNKMGNHLGTTVNAYNSAYKEYGKIDKDVVRITGQSSELEIQRLDKPVQDID